jgi:hypothetical protein
MNYGWLLTARPTRTRARALCFAKLTERAPVSVNVRTPPAAIA